MKKAGRDSFEHDGVSLITQNRVDATFATMDFKNRTIEISSDPFHFF